MNRLFKYLLYLFFAFVAFNFAFVGAQTVLADTIPNIYLTCPANNCSAGSYTYSVPIALAYNSNFGSWYSSSIPSVGQFLIDGFDGNVSIFLNNINYVWRSNLSWTSTSTFISSLPLNFSSYLNTVGTFVVSTSSDFSSIYISTPPQTFLNNSVSIGGTYINDSEYDTIIYNLSNTDLLQQLNIASSSISLVNGSLNWSNSFVLPSIGDYSLQVALENSATGQMTAWSNTFNFSLASTTYNSGLQQGTSTIQQNINILTNLANQSCSIIDIGCNVSKVLSFLFAPTQASLQQFTDLQEKIKNKPPFGYFNMITTNLNTISSTTASSTPAFDIVIPSFLETYIFNPLKIGIDAILWFVALVWLYNRLKQIQL
jgi:hypothetical protein